MIAMLMTCAAALADSQSFSLDLNVFYNQTRPKNDTLKQYSVSLDDMEARGFIDLNRTIFPSDRGYAHDYLDCDMWLYVCRPDIYLGQYVTPLAYALPRIWFEYDGADLYTYDTAIFKIGDTTYTFHDIGVSYDTIPVPD